MNKVIIIAEAGVNHNGSMENAKKLIDAAAAAGVDYVKFQTFQSEKLVSQKAKKAEYQQRTLDSADNTQLSMLKKLELSKEQHYELIDYCKQRSVQFFSTAFDLESVDFLKTLHLGFWKIPSGEITNYPYLKRIASFHEPVILSTGMSDLNDIERAMVVLNEEGLRADQITILHCNTEYPTPMEDVNLKVVRTLANYFRVKTGYSDHTLGIEISLAAVALGASVIEKHFTLDRTQPGPDHQASLEPDELKAMVHAIRNIELALGDGEKYVTASERKNMEIARKSIVASNNIELGEVFTEENITVKRPGTGLSPMLWNTVLGKKAQKSFKIDDLIEI